MNPLTRLMNRQVSIRSSLLSNMLLVVALFGVAVLATTVIGANSIATQLSRSLIGQTIERTDAEVRHFIAPAEKVVALTAQWLREGRIDPADGSGARELLLPVLRVYDRMHGIIVVEPGGRGLSLQRFRNDWRLRLFTSAADGELRSRTLWPLSSPDAQWQTEDYALQVNERPWYAAALRARPGELGWTDAYRFYQTGQPGLSAATRLTGPEEGSWVLAVDLLLEDVSEFSRNLQLGQQGMILITDSIGQIVGLPNLPRFETESARRAAYLEHPRELGFNLAADAAVAFQPDANGSVAIDPVRFRSDGRTWWGQGKWIPLDDIKELWVGVLVPESELLGTIEQLRVLIITVTVLVTLLAIARAFGLARRYSQPISVLADQSLRISQGELEQPVSIRSRLSELLNLAEAQERMRQGLVNLLRLEDDLQLARQIQQKTFPTHFPRCEGIDLAAASRPADATGGDTYDVVGVSERGGAARVVDDDPERLYLLLADATGHGMGPALTASQVRAMFRMGVRLGEGPGAIARQMNEQLHADAHGGRFVTAWLGLIDVSRRRLTMLSAGQAPIILYRRQDDEFRFLDADVPPFGITTDLMSDQLREIDLAPGDILAVISDGVLEARSPGGERFGEERVQGVLRRHRDQRADAMLDALRVAVDEFAAGQPREDDQTAIIVKSS